MEEMQLQDTEQPLQQLEGEYSTEDSLPPQVEELLHVLQSDGLYSARRDAAEQLGKVETSSPRIVRALIAAYESDSYAAVNRAAAQSLRSPVHQACLRRHPDLLEASDKTILQRPVSGATQGSKGEALPRTKSQRAAAETLTPELTHAKMLKQVRSWGLWMLGIGVLSLILSGLSGSWGVVLILVGLASFVFREAPMFVVYGIMCAWAGISNIVSGEAGWIAFGALQLFLTFSILKQYTRYRRAEAALDSALGSQRTGRAFPQIGCALGALALGGSVTIMVGGVLVEAAGVPGVEPIVVWLFALLVELAVLGAAVGTASLLSGFRYKMLAVLGLVASGLVLLTVLALSISA
jgi:hypothetical protein